MDEEKNITAGQSGGVNISGGQVNAKNIVGRDQVAYTEASGFELDQALGPIAEAVSQNEEAKEKVEALKKQTAKRDKADDGVMATLLSDIVRLVPGAVSAVVSAFGTPILGGMAGPVTKWVLKKMQS